MLMYCTKIVFLLFISFFKADTWGHHQTVAVGECDNEEHGAVFYANQSTAVQHATEFNRRMTNGLERCASVRDTQRRLSPNLIRSNSTKCLSSLEYANSNVRYLELLSDSFNSKCNDGYEIPRDIEYKYLSPNLNHQSTESSLND